MGSNNKTLTADFCFFAIARWVTMWWCDQDKLTLCNKHRPQAGTPFKFKGYFNQRISKGASLWQSIIQRIPRKYIFDIWCDENQFDDHTHQTHTIYYYFKWYKDIFITYLNLVARLHADITHIPISLIVYCVNNLCFSVLVLEVFPTILSSQGSRLLRRYVHFE